MEGTLHLETSTQVVLKETGCEGVDWIKLA
jgi:hypothetical protein